MNEINSDIFKLFESGEFDAICITTNGIIKTDGTAVMGKGIALEAKKRFKGIEKRLASKLQKYGNNTYLIGTVDGKGVITFPTKYDWRDNSSPTLIKKSAKQLMDLIDRKGYEKVLITRVGCGNGGLSWRSVRTMVNEYFDERIYVVDKDGK